VIRYTPATCEVVVARIVDPDLASNLIPPTDAVPHRTWPSNPVAAADPPASHVGCGVRVGAAVAGIGVGVRGLGERVAGAPLAVGAGDAVGDD